MSGHAREEVRGIEGEQLVDRVRGHVALHDQDDQPRHQPHDAGGAPLAKVLGPACTQQPANPLRAGHLVHKLTVCIDTTPAGTMP